ncbi:hypothetical protein R5W23_005180 [Gemmata sp. JC673]|uniref:Uncharacterized protein n=1 Tax=Gemmata algarum TaxID=2975278 RepID=A0ABU5F8A1_9BACT|nr:hypothetical protein [Gemmata algarum]MDY3563566.1 hypothetical protein [Gemmata algarum]
MMSLPATQLPALIAGLEAAGIRTTLRRLDPATGNTEYVCRRGPVSFALGAFHDPEAGGLFVSFTADLSRWRWWNFPFLWLAGLPRAPWELRLQRDAYAVLWSLGTRRPGGGDEPDAEPGAAPDQTT